MQASPESTPALKDLDPKGPTWSLGLLGAKASSSMGLKTALGFLFLLLKRYVPLVPSSVSLGLNPLRNPSSISLMLSWSYWGHCIDPKTSMHEGEEVSWSPNYSWSNLTLFGDKLRSFSSSTAGDSNIAASLFWILLRFKLLSLAKLGASLSFTILFPAMTPKVGNEMVRNTMKSEISNIWLKWKMLCKFDVQSVAYKFRDEDLMLIIKKAFEDLIFCQGYWLHHNLLIIKDFRNWMQNILMPIHFTKS